MARKKLAMIGGGQIGAVLALLAAQRELGDVVLLDVPTKADLVKGKALDLGEGTPLLGSDIEIQGTSDWKAAEGADVAIITAGAPRRPGMTREDLLATNLKAISNVAGQVKKHCPGAFCIVVTNPMDAMVYAFYKLSGLPENQVVGMAGVLNTARYRWFIACELGVSAEDVAATVIGGHGPTMVPLPRLTTVGGIPLAELMPRDKIDAIVARTREAGTEIVNLLGNGGPYVSPAVSAMRMAESYLRDKKRVCACAAFCHGEYGVEGYYIGVHAVIGAGGVERIIEVRLTEDERQQFERSFEAVRKATAETGL